MPGKLFTGEDAQDVAAYVASAVSKPGEDKGQLGAAGVKRSTEVAKEQAASSPSPPTRAARSPTSTAPPRPARLDRDRLGGHPRRGACRGGRTDHVEALVAEQSELLLRQRFLPRADADQPPAVSR